MSSLKDTVKAHQEAIMNGIAWVVFWRESGGHLQPQLWKGEDFYLEINLHNDTLSPGDKKRMKEIQAVDPSAVVLNGYFSEYLDEAMSLEDLITGVCRHYHNGMSGIAQFIREHSAAS